MRTIKFRGLTTQGEWIYGYLYQDETGTYIKEPDQNKRFGTGFEVNPETVGQSSNLKDKNGKEIYEGDIVQNVADDGRRLSIFEISWQQSSCGFVKEREDGSRFTLEISKHLEVIGNIHEHAHLLV